MKPRVAVIATGSELMRGRSIDTHLAHFARKLEAVGLEIDFHSTCGDDFGRLVDEIKLAASRADVVILSGGLGPTEDDLTRPAVEEAFHRPLKFQPALWKTIAARFKEYKIPMAAINKRQADLPEGAKSLPNPNGSAPGFSLVADGVRFYAMPGPPREMIPMFDGVVRDLVKAFKLKKTFELWESKVYGVPEGDVDEIVKPIAAKHGATYGLTVSGGTVNITIRVEGKPLKPIVVALIKKLGIRLVGPLSLEETVAKMLMEQKLTIAVAESCTGGLISHKLTNVAGISASLLEGRIVYSNNSKVDLGVSEESLREHGAVSDVVAAQLADMIRLTASADIGVATTGIAGPGGGSAKKPVGLVCHAVSYRGKVVVESRVFPGERGHVKERATNFALDLVRRAIIGGGGDGRPEVGLRADGPERRWQPRTGP